MAYNAQIGNSFERMITRNCISGYQKLNNIRSLEKYSAVLQVTPEDILHKKLYPEVLCPIENYSVDENLQRSWDTPKCGFCPKKDGSSLIYIIGVD